MNDIVEAAGQCLCGAIRIQASHIVTHLHACHCDMCRRWGGGPFMSVDGGQKVSFDGEEHMTVYASSAWAERGFCQHCGTHLFYRIKDSHQYYIPIGLLEPIEGVVFLEQIFIDRKPPYYGFANETHNLTEKEVMVLFEAESASK